MSSVWLKEEYQVLKSMIKLFSPVPDIKLTREAQKSISSCVKPYQTRKRRNSGDKAKGKKDTAMDSLNPIERVEQERMYLSRSGQKSDHRSKGITMEEHFFQ